MNCYLLFLYNYKHRKIPFYSMESKNYSVLEEEDTLSYLYPDRKKKKVKQLFH